MEYGEFIIACADGNPLQDFKDYVLKGNVSILYPYFFQLSANGGEKLQGRFLSWLGEGIRTGKFSSLSHLPKGIESYYTDESFASVEEKKTKQVVDIEDIPVF